MPICEADPWRMQYFERHECPAHVRVPTEDADAWAWYPAHRGIYNKLAVALSQNILAAPHGVTPPHFPVFSKPISNLKGMGLGSRRIRSAAEYDEAMTPGHMWMELLRGAHLSSDVAVVNGEPRWWRHATGIPSVGGTFDHWRIHAEASPAVEAWCGDWMARHLGGYTGMANFETIGGRIIEAHLRFADQWPDLYGPGWVEALIGLYHKGVWRLDDHGRREGFSVVLFGPHGRAWRHPHPTVLESVRAMPGIASVQIPFHEDRPASLHPMPPGGFRLAVVNCWDLAAGMAARRRLWQHMLMVAGPLPRDRKAYPGRNGTPALEAKPTAAPAPRWNQIDGAQPSETGSPMPSTPPVGTSA